VIPARLSTSCVVFFCCYWRCPHSMRRRVYVTVGCPSVRLSVPSSIDCSSGGRRVCCWRLQQISIDSSERRAAWRRRSAANAGSVLLRSDGGGSTETSSRRRCRRRFAGCSGAGSHVERLSVELQRLVATNPTYARSRESVSSIQSWRHGNIRFQKCK